MIIVIILALLFVFFLAIGLIDGNRFVVVEEEFALPKLKKECKFVLISDVHNKVYGENNALFIKAVKKINPDFIILAGDLVTSSPNEDMEPGIALVKALSSDYKVYFGLGNHEEKIKQQRDKFQDQFALLKKKLTHPNIVWLENESAEIPKYNIKITGLALALQYFAHFQLRKMEKDYLKNVIGTSDRTKCNLLIAHNPDYFSEYAKWGADLVLSGHVHGGIMRLPLIGGVISPSYRLFPKYDGGVFWENDAVMLLGRGMGSHTIPFRFFNPAQLYAVTLKPCK
ncbi:MAG: metallophosphoesterase [Lachnospiraceae bacterium]|nr:metallophosphoesterase [Lachnospiraceae bacterium]